MTEAFVEPKPDGYYSHARNELLALLAPSEVFTEALELGCGAGETLRVLLESGRVKRAVGVELHPAAAKQAAARISNVIEEDVEEWAQHPHGVKAPDLVIIADVLEHLRDPWTVLRQVRDIQPPGGQLLLSIPNIQHFSISLPLLLRGRWRYVPEGILDRTHLRFFGLEGVIGLLRGAGYTPQDWDFVAGDRGRLAAELSLGVLRPWVARQYLVRCRVA